VTTEHVEGMYGSPAYRIRNGDAGLRPWSWKM